MTPAAGADLEIARLLELSARPGSNPRLARRVRDADPAGQYCILHGRPLRTSVEIPAFLSAETNVLVLGNHGLVVCGDDCEAAERLLQEVESRVAIEPRPTPEPG